MKPLLASFLTLCLLAACSSISPAPTPTVVIDVDLDHLQPDLPIFREPLIESQRSILAKMNDATVYRIEFIIDEDLIHVDGKETVFYTNRETEPLGNIQFRLFPNLLGGKMEVRDLLVDGKPVTPSYGLENSLMTVPLENPLAVGQSVRLEMDFSLEVPTDVELNYGVLASYEGVLTLAHAYPVIPVYNEEGWNAELPPQAGDLTFNDAAFYLVSVTAPKDLTIVASGLESAPVAAGRQQVMNVAIGPARDFFLAASRDYEVISQQVGEVTVNSYAPKSLQEQSQAALTAAVRAINTFSEQYAPYPYTEFDIVVTPTLALGIEYPGATAIAERILLGEYGEQTSAYLESTVVHEVGHQWFYNLVGNDQLDDPWLDESLTQFATLQYFSDQYGQSGYDGFRYSLEGRWSRTNRAEIPVGLPVRDYKDIEYGSIVYGRGGLFFETLRDEMGSDNFDVFIKAYVKNNSWDIATPEKMQELAEQNCACDLTALFNDWIYP